MKEKRTEVIKVRLTKEEKAILIHLAAHKGNATLSEIIRWKLLDDEFKK